MLSTPLLADESVAQAPASESTATADTQSWLSCIRDLPTYLRPPYCHEHIIIESNNWGWASEEICSYPEPSKPEVPCDTCRGPSLLSWLRWPYRSHVVHKNVATLYLTKLTVDFSRLEESLSEMKQLSQLSLWSVMLLGRSERPRPGRSRRQFLDLFMLHIEDDTDVPLSSSSLQAVIWCAEVKNLIIFGQHSEAHKLLVGPGYRRLSPFYIHGSVEGLAQLHSIIDPMNTKMLDVEGSLDFDALSAVLDKYGRSLRNCSLGAFQVGDLAETSRAMIDPSLSTHVRQTGYLTLPEWSTGLRNIELEFNETSFQDDVSGERFIETWRRCLLNLHHDSLQELHISVCSELLPRERKRLHSATALEVDKLFSGHIMQLDWSLLDKITTQCKSLTAIYVDIKMSIHVSEDAYIPAADLDGAWSAYKDLASYYTATRISWRQEIFSKLSLDTLAKLWFCPKVCCGRHNDIDHATQRDEKEFVVQTRK